MGRGEQVPIAGALADRRAVLTYLLLGYEAGRPFTVTLRSLKSGAHFTYRLRPWVVGEKKPGARKDASRSALIHFDVRSGPDETHYSWGGLLSWTGARVSDFEAPRDALPGALASPIALLAGARCTHEIGGLSHAPQMGEDSDSVKALRWLLGRMNAGVEPAPLAEVWHAGRCCMCGRALTRPDSIAAGIGPDCAERLMARGGVTTC